MKTQGLRNYRKEKNNKSLDRVKVDGWLFRVRAIELVADNVGIIFTGLPLLAEETERRG